MKSAILLITLLCCTSAGWAQSHTFGLRLSYFTGRYSYPVSSIYHYGVWKEQPEGLEVALQYRLALGQSPLYVQTEVGYYNRRIDGSAQEPVLDAPRVVLKGQQSYYCCP